MLEMKQMKKELSLQMWSLLKASLLRHTAPIQCKYDCVLNGESMKSLGPHSSMHR